MDNRPRYIVLLCDIHRPEDYERVSTHAFHADALEHAKEALEGYAAEDGDKILATTQFTHQPEVAGEFSVRTSTHDLLDVYTVVIDRRTPSA